MAAKWDTASGTLARYLNRCRAAGKAPDKHEAMTIAEAEGNSGNTVAKVWKRYEAAGWIETAAPAAQQSEASDTR